MLKRRRTSKTDTETTDPAEPPRLSRELVRELTLLRKELARLNSHRFIRTQNSAFRLLMFQFFKGLALGLGTVMGASILVSVVLYFLSQIELLPIIGDWASEIARQMELDRP